MGSDQQIGQDHLAGATTLALGGMGSCVEDGRLPRDGRVVVEMGWQECIQGFDALTGKADLAVDDGVDHHGTGIQPVHQLAAAPVAPAAISGRHVEDHVGVDQHHQGWAPVSMSPRVRARS
jgi:hypothetical protein